MFNNPQAQQDLEQVVTEFVQQHKVFTAAHVTVEVRRRHMAAGVLPHRGSIAPGVRELFEKGQMPGYIRTFVPGTVYAYHPADETVWDKSLGIDAKDWKAPLDVSEIEAAKPAVVHKVTPGHAQAPDTDRKYLRAAALQDGTAVTRKWRAGRYVEVPREMLRKAGFSRGDAVKAAHTDEGVYLVKSSPSSMHVQNSRLALRVNRKALTGFDTSRDVIFRFEDGRIFLEQ